MAHLIVLSGEAGAGKDSVANVLIDRHGWQLYSLAAPLKRFAGDMFGFTHEQLYGPSTARNAPDPRWARPCPRCAGRGKQVLEIAFAECWIACQICGGAGKLNDNSPRRVLQLAGEEFVRQMIHIDALSMRARPEIACLLANDTSVVVNDARFSNDRNNLHAWLGAQRVDVRAATKKLGRGEGWRQHSSERDRPDVTNLEHVIYNEEEYPFPSLERLVSEALQRLFPTG